MANNQMVNFNSQDVANMYRRNQLANALQERMNAPTPVHTFQGFQAPISPLTGISKALDMYTAKKYDDQQEDKYQAEKVAAEQKVLDENSRLEQDRENFVSNLNQPIYSETPMPDARSSIESGIPLDQPRPDIGTGEYTSTPKTPQEKLAFALSQQGSNNPLIANQAKAFVDQGNEDIRAKTAADLAASNRDYTRFIDERTRQDMLSGRDQTQKNTDRTFGQNQFNADRTFNESTKVKPPVGYTFNGDGSLNAIRGGPADLKINAESVKKTTDANDVISILDVVDTLLPKSTGSLIGTGIDAVSGFVGKTPKGAEAAQQLRMLQGALISKMPKMSGPQSDKDVLLYRQMAGEIGDSTIPVKNRQAAATMLRTLNRKYSDAPLDIKSVLDMYAPEGK